MKKEDVKEIKRERREKKKEMKKGQRSTVQWNKGRVEKKSNAILDTFWC